MREGVGVDGVHMHLENKKISRNFFWMLWIMYAVVHMTKNCYSAAMASIVNEGILTKSQTGLVTAVFYGVYAPLQILGGVFADKYNPERMIKIGLVGSGIANLIIFFNQNYYVMLIVWTFNAIIQFALWPSVFKIISSQLEQGYMVKGVYYISFSSTFGLILSYFIAAIVSKWQDNFVVSALALFVFAILFHVVSNRVEKHMVPDNTPRQKGHAVGVRESQIPTWKLFLYSGFYLLIVVTVLRTITANGIQTLSATFLMESYEDISPSIGNLLNILIIVAGIVGVILISQFIYPRLIRNEVVVCLVLIVVAIIPVSLMSFVGKIPAFAIVASLCVSALLLTGTNMLMGHCCAAFARYGKNGLASGVNNSCSSIAIMLQSYVIVAVADNAGWKTVIYLWIVMLVISAVCLVIVIPLWRRYKKK